MHKKLVLLLATLVSTSLSAEPNQNDYQFLQPRTAYIRIADTSADPALNVKADFLFDESSGTITDEINSIACTEAGNPTYSQTIGFPYASMTPGILYDSTTDSHNNLSPQAVLDASAGDHVVFEWGVIKNSSSSPDYFFSVLGGAGSTDYNFIAWSGSTTDVRFWIKSEDGTSVNTTFTVNTYDSTPRIYQVYFERDVNVELFENGNSQGTASVATLAGKVFQNEGLRLGSQFNGGGESLDGTMFRWRMSVGTDVLGNSILLE